MQTGENQIYQISYSGSSEGRNKKFKGKKYEKIIAAINMTVDGFCDHTAVGPGEEIHQHYADLLSNGGIALYGRITYQLMEYWRTVVKNPTGIKATDEFAVVQ